GAVLGAAAVSISGSATDATDPIELTIEGTRGDVFHEDVASPGNSWSASVVLPDDSFTVVARQLEPEGPVQSPPVKFAVKTKAPAVSLFAPTVSHESVRFSGHAGDGAGDNAQVIVSVFDESGAEVQRIPTGREGEAWALEGLELPPGIYSVQVTQADSLGHVGESSRRTFAISAPNAPVVALDTSQFESRDGALTSATAMPAFRTLPVANGRSVRLNLYAGTSAAGEPLQSVAMTPTGEVWSASASSALANGIYTAQAVVEDSSGRTGVSSPVIFAVAVATPSVQIAGAPASPPAASFTWVPASPTVGERVSLVSNSTPGSSALSAFAWDFAGTMQFAAGPSVTATTFATVGAHVVRLRATDADGLSGVTSRTIVVGPATAKLMQPFPIVRIAGAETNSGVRVRLLTVQAPLSTKIVVTCSGPGCKTKSESRMATTSAKTKLKAGAVLLTFKRFERSLRAGVVLQIRVTKSGQIGKFTSFKIRRHKLPLRSDACLRPASSAPSACPTS
ncbi:MAG: PKD domain-containing protein, partial [Solirubrobacteraceae bacterium]